MEEVVEGEEEPVQEEEVGPVATTEPAGPQLDELLARLPTLMNRKFVDEVHVCVYVCMYVCVYIYMYVCVRMHVCMYVCMYVCCICVCTCTVYMYMSVWDLS